MSPEEWRPVANESFTNAYEVSSFGRVRSANRVRLGRFGWQQCDGKVLRPRIGSAGYYQTAFWKDGKAKYLMVHRIVAMAFVENPEGFPIVNHIDGVKTNNAASNLEWTSDRLNKQHAIDIGKITLFNKLLTADEVAEIRKLGGTMTQTDIANRFGTTQTNVSLILSGRTHKPVDMVNGQ